ncbi:hypothetical protein ACJVC5_09935 [Peredibacter sp. HCB2-198]|uniref:hypothetical protein n=1 Tax=Peredibacter sp. HCB2-198 TaxID=3383025 RepID=UPI0038B47CA5
MKLALLFNLLIGGVHAKVVSSDRFLIKILDRTVSFQDINFQFRNFKALSCLYDDSMVVQYFDKSFIKDLESFVTEFPEGDDEVRRFMHGRATELKKIRHFFKMLRYSEDQKNTVSPKLAQIIREGTLENKCGAGVLYKDTLKTNFITLMELELYLRARYGGQLKNNQKFESIRPSIELFVESLDKQFGHEYYW